MTIRTVGFQLKSLADLLQRVYASVDLAQISRCIVLHVRSGLPREDRKTKALNKLEENLITALEDLYLSSLHEGGTADGMNPSLTRSISTAETMYQSLIDQAARMLDRAELVTSDGSVLRASSDAIAEAAVDVIRRRSNEFALELARELERLGSAPSLLFQLDGRIVWTNHALVELIEHRRLNRPKLLHSACRFAAPLCASLRRREELPERRLKRRSAETDAHFHARVRRRDERAGETLLLVEITEALRSTELSPRELEVARLVACHGSYQMAADLAEVSIDSVRTYIRRIYRKMGVTSRTKLKARLIREGLLEPS
jgi:DNA-binding CsgD family transcriptional regulator